MCHHVLWILQYSINLCWCKLSVLGNTDRIQDISIQDNTLEKGETVKLFHPKDFWISGVPCEIGGYPGVILAAGQLGTLAVLKAY